MSRDSCGSSTKNSTSPAGIYHEEPNGREPLAQQLEKKGIEFQRRGNCFTDIENVPAAQRLMDQQRRTRWPGALNGS